MTTKVCFFSCEERWYFVFLIDTSQVCMMNRYLEKVGCWSNSRQLCVQSRDNNISAHYSQGGRKEIDKIVATT